jgi:hypothetical protein
MLVYLLAAACAVGIVLIASRLVHGEPDDKSGGVTASHVGSMVSALFLVAFAIAIVVPWTTADAARLNTHTESKAIAEAAWAAQALPAPEAQQIHTALRDYAQYVRDQEWTQVDDGRLSPAGWTRLEALRRKVTAMSVEGDEQVEARASVLEQLAEVTAARRVRAADVTTSTPSGVLVMTVLTGLAVLLLPLLAGAQPRGRVLVGLAVMAAMLGIGVYLTLNIAHPFSGSLAVRPDAFSTVLVELQRVTAGG